MSRLQRREWLEEYREKTLEQTPIAFEIEKEKLQDFVLRMAGFLEESNIIADFGCNSSDLWPLLRDMNLRVVGVSCNRIVKQTKGVRIMNIGFSDFNLLGIFEGFVAVGILQRLQPELWSRTLLKIVRSVKTSGVGLIVTGVSEEEEAKTRHDSLKKSGLPVVVGEYIDDNGNYNFKPLKSWYDQWLRNAGFYIFREEVTRDLVYTLVRK